MFTNVRKCLTASVKIWEQFLARPIHVDIIWLPKIYSHSGTLYLNNIYRRFYCHIAIDEQNLTSTEISNRLEESKKQKLEEFLSDPENKKLFQILELEIDMLRHNAERVPKNIKVKDWWMLLNMKSKFKRKEFLEFLWRNEIRTENEKKKKEIKRAERLAKIEEEKANENPDEIKYGLLRNTMFMRIYDTTINHFYNSKLIQAIMFEPKVVFDCGYENNMTQREIHNCAKQLSIAFANNRLHDNPLCLYFCNFNKNGLLKEFLHLNIPTLMNDDFPIIITPQSYLDVFPKSQLMYLTPHCKTNLNEYDPDTVYIIGALVDKTNSQPLSLAKAKKEGIRMAKFPLENYLEWGMSSSKNFTLDQTMKIVLDWRHKKDWKEALKHIPDRKLKPARDHMLHSKHKKIMMNTEKELKELSNFTFKSRKMS